ncbi:MAG: sulfurtransferase [Actinomycetales bacterium]
MTRAPGFTTLISAEDLLPLVEDPQVVILDARFSLDDEGWGARVFAEGHLPGAAQADLAVHLAGEIIPGVTGRRPFPDPARFAAQLGDWGIDGDTQVVTYDAEGGLMAAARLWLMLRWVGHDRVAVLDGGLPAWLASQGPLTTEVRRRPARFFQLRLRPELLAEVDEVDQARRLLPTRVFDSRGEEGYHGRGHYWDPVRGHIAGAGLADRAATMAADQRLHPAQELRDHYLGLIGDLDPQQVIFYCGSGVTAASNVLAMEHAGLAGSRMYVGSWSEWITDPSREVEL